MARYEVTIQHEDTVDDLRYPCIRFVFETMSSMFTFLDSALISGQDNLVITVRKMSFATISEENDNG